MSRKGKIWLGVGLYFFILIAVGLIFGSDGKNDSFEPVQEFKLDPWIKIDLGFADLSITKAVLYLVIAGLLTVCVMTYIANRMASKPNRVQTAVEASYDLTFNINPLQPLAQLLQERFFFLRGNFKIETVRMEFARHFFNLAKYLAERLFFRSDQLGHKQTG